MSITILKQGLQTTVQGGSRSGMRHLGVPASGAADPLSLALANRLVANPSFTAALELTLSRVALRFDTDNWFAVTGAKTKAKLNGERIKLHRTLVAKAGDELEVGAARAGARNYLAVAGGFVVTETLGSVSTYLPAGLGGHQGRALEAGDVLETGVVSAVPPMIKTLKAFRPRAPESLALRACDGPDVDLLDKESRFDLFDTNFTVGARSDRMGIQLEGVRLRVTSEGRMASAPVFPGTIQCPEDGRPFLLSVDAQTTGGYSRVAQIARADRHLLGQLRPGMHLRLLWRDVDAAIEELAAKHDYWRPWLADVTAVI